MDREIFERAFRSSKDLHDISKSYVILAGQIVPSDMSEHVKDLLLDLMDEVAQEFERGNQKNDVTFSKCEYIETW